MDAYGERIIIFGDSISHHGADSDPEIWDVNAGSSRSSSQPGDLLASLLAEQGAQAVRVNARVSRSAFNFFQRENTTGLFASDRAFKPTKVVIVLGTNDIGLSIARDQEAMTALRDAYKSMGAEVWAIGPFTYASPSSSLNQQTQPVVDMMSKVFGGRFIDGRPLSVNVNRARDGVHFTPDSARPTALAMADALLSQASPKNWLPMAVGAIAVVGSVFAYSWWKHGTLPYSLKGLNIVDGKRWSGSESELVRSGAKQVPCKSGLDRHARCWKGLKGLNGRKRKKADDLETIFGDPEARKIFVREMRHEIQKKEISQKTAAALAARPFIVKRLEDGRRALFGRYQTEELAREAADRAGGWVETTDGTVIYGRTK